MLSDKKKKQLRLLLSRYQRLIAAQMLGRLRGRARYKQASKMQVADSQNR
jgi:hypothetical protein